jgi:hypothetical protein
MTEMRRLFLQKAKGVWRRVSEGALKIYERNLIRFGHIPSALTILTGANSSHQKSLQQLLSSITYYESFAKIVVFDLGLTQPEVANLQCRFPQVEIRHFDYSQWPAYFDININAGEYAWKPVIIAEALEEFQGQLLWLDAGCVVVQPLLRIRKVLQRSGFYSPLAGSTVGEWTHPATLAMMGLDKKHLTGRQFSGGIVGVNYAFLEARKLVHEWKTCALNKDCIAPIGSSRANHRQDQAVLSILIYQSSFWHKMPHCNLGFATHQDID